jgi:zinc and cadmium transporter
MSLGVVGMFCIERFIAPHSHEVDGGGHHPNGHDCGHHHEHPHEPAVVALPVREMHRAAAPAVAGWMAVLGLTIHTFMNGVGLAGAVEAGVAERASLAPASVVAVTFPGWALFLAIVLHKPADALAISTVLSRKGVSRQKLLVVQACFACMVPIGAAAFLLARQVLQDNLASQLTGAALAFSAGTFLFIALSDLLPEVQFHQHDRIPLFLALILGVGFMGLVAYLEPHGETKPEPGHSQGEGHGNLNWRVGVAHDEPARMINGESREPAGVAGARNGDRVSREVPV